MNSRERVLSALNHQEPDRVPIDFGGHRSSGINAMAYARLKKYMGIKTGDIYVYDMVQQLAIVENQVLDALKIDTIELGRGFMLEAKDWKDWVLPDGTPCKIAYFVNVAQRGGDRPLVAVDGCELGVQRKGCVFFEQTYWPLSKRDFDKEDFSDLEKAFKQTQWTGIPTPGYHLPLDDAGLKKFAEGAKALRQSTDRAIIGLFGGNMFETPQMLYGMENYLSYLAQYPEAVLRLSETLCKIYLGNLEKWLGAVGPYIDIILFGDDLGSQNGPMISKSMYRKYYKPFHARMWKRAKQLAKVKVMLHSCGAIEPLLDDLIDAGLDAVNPVQISAKGMDAKTLKQKYGDRLCLWGGGCDTGRMLPLGTPEEIAAHTRTQVEILKPGGGFVFQQVHNIMAEVPPENILAMFKAV